MSLLATDNLRAALLVAACSAAGFAFAGLAEVSASTLIVVCGVLVLSVVSPIGVLLAGIASLPYFYRPVDIAGQQVAASEFLLLASAAGTLVHGVLLADGSFPHRLVDLWQRLTSSLRFPLMLASITLMVLGGLLVAFPFDSSQRAESLREWRWTLAEPAILIGLLVWHRRTPSLAKFVAIALVAGGAIASSHALADFLLGGGVSVGGVTRIAGPYPHPNALALMTIRITVLGALWALYDPRVRRYIGPLTIVLFVAVAATFSRGAMLAGFVATAIVLFNAPRNVQYAGGGTVAAAFGLMVLLARDRMLDLFSGGTGSLRLDIWSSALRMIDDRPVSGYGPDQFLYAYLPRYVEPTAWGERFTAHAHNFVFDFWIRLGIIGAAWVSIMVLLCLLTLARRVRDTGEPRALGFAALVALTATIAHGLVDNAYFSHDLAMSCWLLAWLAFGTRPDVATAEGEIDIARAGVGRSRLYRLPSMRQPHR